MRNAVGRLQWEVPEGQWTMLRLGHTSTGVENSPAPQTGRGLECDKLSKEGIEANFTGMMAKVAGDTRIKGGRANAGLVLVKTLFRSVAAHADVNRIARRHHCADA